MEKNRLRIKHIDKSKCNEFFFMKLDILKDDSVEIMHISLSSTIGSIYRELSYLTRNKSFGHILNLFLRYLLQSPNIEILQKVIFLNHLICDMFPNQDNFSEKKTT
jgi:hypothetical protein